MVKEIEFAWFVCARPKGQQALFAFSSFTISLHFRPELFIGVLTCFMAVMTLQLFQKFYWSQYDVFLPIIKSTNVQENHLEVTESF